MAISAVIILLGIAFLLVGALIQNSLDILLDEALAEVALIPNFAEVAGLEIRRNQVTVGKLFVPYAPVLQQFVAGLAQHAQSVVGLAVLAVQIVVHAFTILQPVPHLA